MRYYNFSDSQQYELADSRAEIEADLLPTVLQLGPTIFTPGQLITFGYFTRPLLYVGAEPSTNGKSHSMYFYVGNTADGAAVDLFGKPAGKAVYMVLHWIRQTQYLVLGSNHSGRDFNYLLDTWDWERGPGTALGGRETWKSNR